jgi:uncharacterized membrane protein YcaP (DUF421 family)
MDAILRALLMYGALLILFRVMGKRSLSQVTTFDFVLLLIVSEATQQALLGDDFSFSMALPVIATLVVVDRSMDYLTFRFPRLDRLVQSVPMVLVDNGEVLEDRLARVHVSVDDILGQPRAHLAGAREHVPGEVRRAGEGRRDQHHPEGVSPLSGSGSRPSTCRPRGPSRYAPACRRG